MYQYYTAKIHDSLRTGASSKPLRLSTRDNVYMDNVLCMPYMESPKTRTRGIDPSESSTFASGMSLRIQNYQTEVSDAIYERMNSAGTLFWNEKVEIWGHNGTLKDRIYSGIISDFSSDSLETYYDIEISDVMRMLKTDIFSRELAEYDDLLGDISETVEIVNRYRMPTGFRCEEEVVEDETVRVIIFKGHPITFFLGICQAVFSLPENKVGVSYLDSTYIDYLDIDSIEEVRKTLSNDVYGEFEFKFFESISNPFDFCKEQIFKPCIIFPFVKNDGTLGLKIHQQPQINDELTLFNESNIMKIVSKKNSMDSFVNHIRVDYNHIHNIDEDFFTKHFVSVEPDSFEKTRFLSPKDSPLTFELEGINFNFANLSRQRAIIQKIVDSYFSRYSASIVHITIESTIDNTRNLSVGEYVNFTHETAIDWEGDNQGRRGFSSNINEEIPDPIAKFNVGDVWSGYVKNNRLGIDVEGIEFLDTSEEEITTSFFTGISNSCLTNHNISLAEINRKF